MPETLFSRQHRQLTYSILLVSLTVLIVWGRFFPKSLSDKSNDRVRYHQKTVTVLRVIDGDTLDVDLPDITTGKSSTRIRLWGVDTPETRHPQYGIMHFGPEASAFTSQACLNRKVTLHLEPFEHTRGKYRRLLAYVYLPDNTMLNEKLIVEGMAYADPRFNHVYKRHFIQLQKHAQRASVGLWRDVLPDDYPEWYRRYHKLE